jgi:hypothetical protein
VALALSITLNVLLAHKVRKLTHEQAARITDQLLKVGATVPPIQAKRLEGSEDVISYQSTNRPTVLYIFTPPCTWCARNMDNFKTLVDNAGGKYRFIGVSLSEESLREYVAKNDLTLPVYFGPSTETRVAYRLGGTPQTIVVSTEGRVLQNWMGAYVGDQQSQIERFFQIKLPGLRALPRAEKQEK